MTIEMLGVIAQFINIESVILHTLVRKKKVDKRII